MANVTSENRNLSAWKFLWQVIKPYRWWFVLMLQAPVITAFYVFANNYSFKLLTDAFSTGPGISYHHLIWPISVFIGAQILLDFVWRIQNYATWKSLAGGNLIPLTDLV